jgi:formate C-acetyltransferase
MPKDVKGEIGINMLCSLIKAFCVQGGFFMQIDVADSQILRDAQNSPEDFPALAVRIAGWNARFVTLSREWQDMIIDNIEK